MVTENAYLISNNPDISERVETIIYDLRNRILEMIKPESIILYGSYGRGEGSASLINGKLRLISDIEIGIVSANIAKLAAITTLRGSVSPEGTDVTLSLFVPWRFTRRAASNWAPPSQYLTLEQYDMLAGMKVLYGKDPRTAKNALDPSDIVSWDALRLIFNRVAEFLEASVSNQDSELKIKNAYCKLLIALGDAILLLSKRYDHLLQRRMINLQKLVDGSSDTGELPEVEWQNILDAYKRKLWSDYDGLNYLTMRGEIDSLLLPITRYVTKNIFGWSFDSVDDFAQKYINDPSLSKCSRSFVDQPRIRAVMMILRQGFYSGQLRHCLRGWKASHYSYIQLFKLFERTNGEALKNGYEHKLFRMDDVTKRNIETGLCDWHKTCFIY